MSAQGGGTPKADAVRKLSKGGCVKIQIGGGVKDTNVWRHNMYEYMPLNEETLRKSDERGNAIPQTKPLGPAGKRNRNNK